MSTPVLSKTDFLVSPNSWRKHWRGGGGGYQPSLDPDVVCFSSRQNFKAKVNCFDKIVDILLATSELRKRPVKSDVDNASWDWFRGRKQKARPPKQSCDASCVVPKWLIHQNTRQNRTKSIVVTYMTF